MENIVLITFFVAKKQNECQVEFESLISENRSKRMANH